jgi:tRNA (guanine10-N2)-dimethyltransferase
LLSIPSFIIETERGSGEFPEVEIRSFFEKRSGSKVTNLFDYLFLVTSSSGIDELSFVKRVAKILYVVDEIEQLNDIKIPMGKFYVRVIDINDCHGTKDETHVGFLLGGAGRISFKDPDFVILAYHADKWYITMQIFNRNNREKNKRRAPLRPFFSPISMDPQYASFLVNFGYFPQGSKLMDPFCGGGGILLEAGLRGYEVFGIDILNEMVFGCRMNLKYFGVKSYQVERQDFLKFQCNRKFDGIITDFPYGRNSHISIEKENFYKEASRKMSDILESNSRACIVTDDLKNLDYFKVDFNIDKILMKRVHKSLTRNYVRLIKK